MSLPGLPVPKEKKEGNAERWVISYADLMTLLLALFIVLYASSTRNKAKMSQEADSLVKAFHGTPPAPVQQNTAGRGIMAHQVSAVPKPVPHPAKQTAKLSESMAKQMAAEVLALQKAAEALKNLLAPLTTDHKVTIDAQPLTLTIQLDDAVLFQNGQADLLPPAVAILTSIGVSLKALPQPFSIVIQGYTDNQPIATSQFPTNWALSAARAVSVVTLLQANGVAGSQLSAEGFGEYGAIADNSNDAGRAQNRRVVVVIHAPDPNGK
jgi:chemotaxis protein MotB